MNWRLTRSAGAAAAGRRGGAPGLAAHDPGSAERRASAGRPGPGRPVPSRSQLPPDLAGAIDLVVVVVDPLDTSGPELGVADRARPTAAGAWRRSRCTGRSARSVQIGSTPKRVAVGVDVAGHLGRRRRSSSAAKKADAASGSRWPGAAPGPRAPARRSAALSCGGDARPAAVVDLGLAHPAPQRLGADAELAGDPGDHPEPLAGLLDGLAAPCAPPAPATRAGSAAGRVRASAVAAGLCHCSIFPSKRWSLQQTQYGSTRINAERSKRNHIRQLEALGYTVTLQPAA